MKELASNAFSIEIRRPCSSRTSSNKRPQWAKHACFKSKNSRHIIITEPSPPPSSAAAHHPSLPPEKYACNIIAIIVAWHNSANSLCSAD
jgi:hypothetical protein